MRSTGALRPSLALAAMILPLGTLQAQRYWHDDQGRNAIRLEAAIPSLKGSGHKFFTGTTVPSVSIRLGEGFRLEGDLPMTRASFDYPSPTGQLSAFRLGNPYVGLRIGDDTKLATGTLGFRAPVAAKPTDAIGALAVDAGKLSNQDEFEAFASNVMTVRGGVEVRKVGSRGWLIGARGGSSLLMSTDGSPLTETEIYFDYGVRGGYEKSKVLLTGAVTGRYLINQHDLTFNERTFHNAVAAVEVRAGTVRPRVTVRIPFDKDIRDEMKFAIGLGLTFAY